MTFTISLTVLGLEIACDVENQKCMKDSGANVTELNFPLRNPPSSNITNDAGIDLKLLPRDKFSVVRMGESPV